VSINRRRNRRRFRRCLSSRGARLASVRARTVLEGVIFLALASAFIALRVSLSPFASRYASTAGTRSAAFALITQLSVSWRLRRAATRCAPALLRNEEGVFKRKERVWLDALFLASLSCLAPILVSHVVLQCQIAQIDD
jgi:hypothetical protein